MKRALTFITPVIAAFWLAGCSTTPDDISGVPVDELYREAAKAMEYGNNQKAETFYNRIMSRYPFTEYATQAHLDILMVYLQMGEPESLVEEADRFVRENPRHPNVDYVYYMRALAFYPQMRNPLEKFFEIDLAQRDINDSEQSFRYFLQMISRFPDSKYVGDAKLRMVELKQRIARHEMHVADYYLRRGAWVSALRRAEKVLKDFQDTPTVVDALIVAQRSYEELQLPELAETPRRILAANPEREPVVVDRSWVE